MMRDKEIQLFSDGMNFAKDELFFDAITSLNELIIQFPDSELIDDAIYNIGLCYFNMNQFDKAITYLNKCIVEFPDGVISVLTGGNEYGRTAAKCYYAIMNCYLGLGKIDDAKISLNKLSNYRESYLLLENGEKITYEKLAINAYQVFRNQNN